MSRSFLIGTIVMIVTAIFLGALVKANADEWKTVVSPNIAATPEALVAFMHDHGEDIAITGDRKDDCFGGIGMWLSGYGVVLKVFRKTDHPQLKAAIICQDYAGDYYVQPDDRTIIQGQP